MRPGYCTFCLIVAGRLPSRVRYEDGETLVINNRLDWLPVMLRVVPKRRLRQAELWRSGPLMSRVASLAVRMGVEHCPRGFRFYPTLGRTAFKPIITATLRCSAALLWANRCGLCSWPGGHPVLRVRKARSSQPPSCEPVDGELHWSGKRRSASPKAFRPFGACPAAASLNKQWCHKENADGK